MQDKSFAHRGYFTKRSFDTMERLLRNPKFRETILTRTAQVSNVFRIAVSLGLAELERRYSKDKTDGKTE